MAADSRGPNIGDGAGGGGARGRELMSQGDGEDPEVLCEANGAGDRGEDVIWEAAVEPERKRTEVEPRG